MLPLNFDKTQSTKLFSTEKKKKILMLTQIIIEIMIHTEVTVKNY